VLASVFLQITEFALQKRKFKHLFDFRSGKFEHVFKFLRMILRL